MNIFDWIFGRRRRPPSPPPPSPPPPPPSGGDAAAMLAAHNAVRTARGLHPLALDARLVAAAQGHAGHMAAIGVLAHAGIGDGDPWSRIRAAGFEYRLAGENIAMGYRDAAAVVASWLADPPHAANVLGDFTVMGCGRSGDYWCGDYARA